MSRSDRGFAVFARKNVGFADKRVAAPAKGEERHQPFRGDCPYKYIFNFIIHYTSALFILICEV